MRQKDSTNESAHQTICQRKAHGGITECRAAVEKINTSNETGGTNKLKGISKLNNFEFTEPEFVFGVHTKLVPEAW